MSTPVIAAVAGLTAVFFIALFGGYFVGSDAAERDNRADARLEQTDTNIGEN